MDRNSRPIGLPPIISARAIVMLFAALAATASRAAAQTPISACMKITTGGAYKLVSNLISQGQDCLTIAASGVSIDLNGFSIIGNGQGTGVTDGGFAQGAVVVKNGTIISMGYGISMVSYGARIDNIMADVNTTDGVDVGSYAVVTNVQAENNGQDGINVGSDSSVTGCIAMGNGGAGITSNLSYKYSSLIKNNIATGGTYGIVVIAVRQFGPLLPWYVLLADNVANGSQYGLSVRCPANVQNNTSNSSQFIPISTPCVFSDNIP